MNANWRRWSLRRQLVVGVSAVVMIAVLTVGTMSIVSLRSSVLGIIDTQLAVTADGGIASMNKYRSTPGPDGDLPAPGAMKPLTHLIGQAPGNVVALVRNGAVVDSAYFGDGDAQQAPPGVVAAIAQLSWSDPAPRSVELAGLGWYRIVGTPGTGDEVLVTAVSRTPAWDAMVRETLIVAGLTVLALIVAAVGTFAVVRIALRPLSRVASTAAEVAMLPLNRDQYAITPRVPVGDTDPRTEVGLVGDALNRLLANVESALADVAASDRRMRQFITDASHELRTPLAAIQGYAELTRQDADVLPHTTEYSLARIEAESARMNALVSDLLLLARLDEGQDMETTELDIAELVVNAVNDATVSAPTHRWVTVVTDDPVWVRGDRAKVHQAIANLLANARIHTPEGTTVTTTLAVREESILLTVVDDGSGIPADLLPHLFERFVRADKSRSRQAGNSGLGLAIAASIVEAHGGAIDATSGAGTTTFAMSLPLPIAAARETARSPVRAQ